MRRFLIYIATALMTLYFGSWLDGYVREPRNRVITDCFCTSVQCRVLTVIDHPVLALSHPIDAYDFISAARWKDGW